MMYKCGICGKRFIKNEDARGCEDAHCNHRCNICGKKFVKKNDADNCEAKHFVPKELKGYEYNVNDRKNQYPESIKVVLEDNKGKKTTITYYRNNKFLY